MLSSAVFGGIEARAALQKSMFDDEQKQVGIDWCVGSCQKWDETSAGQDRMKLLKTMFAEWGEEHPEEFSQIRKEQNVRTTEDD